MQQDEDEVWPISAGALRELWTVFHTDVVIQACRAVIVSRLLSGGLAFVNPTSRKVPDREFTERVQREFVPFARDVVDALLVQGFAAFLVDSRAGIPTVVPPDVCSYAVKMHATTLRRSLLMTRPGASKPDPKALFVVENMPYRDGIPHSPLASYRRTHAFRGMVELNTATADYSAARPMIYTTTDSDKAFDRKYVYRNAMDTAIDARAMVEHLGIDPGLDTTVQDVHKQAYDLMLGINSAVSRTNADHERAMRTAGDHQAQLAADLNRGRLDPRSVCFILFYV